LTDDHGLNDALGGRTNTVPDLEEDRGVSTGWAKRSTKERAHRTQLGRFLNKPRGLITDQGRET
jgi:hypothetical protein